MVEAGCALMLRASVQGCPLPLAGSICIPQCSATYGKLIAHAYVVLHLMVVGSSKTFKQNISQQRQGAERCAFLLFSNKTIGPIPYIQDIFRSAKIAGCWTSFLLPFKPSFNAGSTLLFDERETLRCIFGSVYVGWYVQKAEGTLQ